jgi:hypothetical protein
MNYLTLSRQEISKGFLFIFAPRGEEYNLGDPPALPGIPA